jgi:hypothetical protein
MNLIRSLVCLVVLAISLTASSNLVAQKSDVDPDREPLAILIGRASNTSSLVRPEKLYGTGQNLPQASEYLVATIHKFRIDEVVRGNKTIRPGQTISVLIPGPVNVTHRVTLSAQRKYLIQLASLVDGEKYKGTVVMDLAHPSELKQPFDPHDVFTLIRDINSAVPITEDTKGLIKRIRREAKR